ncbi:eukaryotic aspartyl protease family protein [Striga asiatica]|uniref:Eukaryotic aspartyl protease family protein n=1 Tax=Striga asiatica TaxID=4170 RepID=A0A5A7QRM3_STRAF|nr:eukaryotic aspartyl protease family protein [Striga asiatica]
MASCKSLFIIFLTTLIYICDSTTVEKKPPARSQSFRLELGSLSKSSISKYAATSPSSSSSSRTYNSSVRVSSGPIVFLPIGTPSQLVPLVLDTGSQLSWAHCSPKRSKNSSAFIPSLSSSYHPILCRNNSNCPTSHPDDQVPLTCTNLRCTFSVSYADGTPSEGSLVHDTFTFSDSHNSPSPLIIGCSHDKDSSGAEGILGMNLGNFSLVSQLQISKFSYCISSNNLGFFYIGDNTNNPNYITKRIDFTNFPGDVRPNLDEHAYTVTLVAIRINGTKLNVSESAFRPDANGSGQTILDSATGPMYLVDEAYAEVKSRVESLTGARFNMTTSKDGLFEMCFTGNNNVTAAAERIGELGLVFDGGVEMVIPMERAMVDEGDGVSCVGIVNSMSRPGNILGHLMFRDVLMEYDVVNKKIGFGESTGCGS